MLGEASSLMTIGLSLTLSGRILSVRPSIPVETN
jgi:hypothetical protein